MTGQTSHLLAAAVGCIVGVVVGASLALGGGSEPEAVPTPAPTPTATTYVCRIEGGMATPGPYRLEVAVVNATPGTRVLPLTCSPAP